MIGGVAAAVFLLILLIVCCCCCRKRHCCETVKEEEIEIGQLTPFSNFEFEFQKQIFFPAESRDHSQNNPLYFGVSTILYSGGGSLRPKPHPDNTYTDLTKMAEIDVNGSTTALVSSKYGTLITPPISPPAPGDEPHYEHIPAQNGVAGDHYQLLDKPPPPPPPLKGASVKRKESLLQKSGQYDKLEERGRGKENPYVSSPTRGHRDMYTLLPSSSELKKMAENYDSDS